MLILVAFHPIASWAPVVRSVQAAPQHPLRARLAQHSHRPTLSVHRRPADLGSQHPQHHGATGLDHQETKNRISVYISSYIYIIHIHLHLWMLAHMGYEPPWVHSGHDGNLMSWNWRKGV
jgi:hypothetical protein